MKNFKVSLTFNQEELHNIYFSLILTRVNLSERDEWHNEKSWVFKDWVKIGEVMMRIENIITKRENWEIGVMLLHDENTRNSEVTE